MDTMTSPNDADKLVENGQLGQGHTWDPLQLQNYLLELENGTADDFFIRNPIMILEGNADS